VVSMISGEKSKKRANLVQGSILRVKTRLLGQAASGTVVKSRYDIVDSRDERWKERVSK
jgi:hypothetical protein